MQVSSSYTATQGRAYGAQFQVRLPQGQQNVYFLSPGEFRRENEHWLHLRIHKILPQGCRIASSWAPSFGTCCRRRASAVSSSSVFTSPNFGKQSSWAIPRQLMFRVRAYY